MPYIARGACVVIESSDLITRWTFTYFSKKRVTVKKEVRGSAVKNFYTLILAKARVRMYRLLHGCRVVGGPSVKQATYRLKEGDCQSWFYKDDGELCGDIRRDIESSFSRRKGRYYEG